MLEEEFGMREVPKAMPRFGATASSSFFLTLVLLVLLNLIFFLCITTRHSTQCQHPSHHPKNAKRRLLRLQSHVEAPLFTIELRRTLWGCNVDDANLPRSHLEDVGFPPKGFPDYHANGGQDNEVDQDVATLANGTVWSSESDEEPRPCLFFPIFRLHLIPTP